jgi:hypothetical protein
VIAVSAGLVPLAEPARGDARGDGHLRVLHQQVDVIVVAVALREYRSAVLAHLREDPGQVADRLPRQDARRYLVTKAT